MGSSSESKGESGRGAFHHHVILVPYPTQGHINPMLQFGKRLISKGLKTTLVATNSLAHLLPRRNAIQFDTISDGYDEGGFAQAESTDAYLARFRDQGSKTLADLIQKLESTQHPIDCVVYDSFLPWALDVGKHFGLATAAFFTQPCAVNYIYYRAHRGLLTLPLITAPTTTTTVSIPGLPLLDFPDMPSFFCVPGSYPAYFEMVLNQFSNAGAADCALVNTFYELESEVIDTMSKSIPNPLMAIGPTIPSLYLDNRVENDNDYDVNLFKLDASTCLDWLSAKPRGSVVYVSFGSLASLGEDQMQELGSALNSISPSFSYLWVVRDSEAWKLPKEDFVIDSNKKGGGLNLIVNWSPQLKVISSEAVGCFLTHGGWNSTTEALSLGVPMVVMPQWTDQTTNAKLVEDVWGVGLRVKTTSGIARKEDIESCIRQVMMMGGDRGKVLKGNATKWKELAKKAVDEGGSSDKNIDAFVSMLNMYHKTQPHLHG